MDLRAHIVARIAAGATLMSEGRVLADLRRGGEQVVMLDPETGGELRQEDPALGPFYVLSTDRQVDGDPHIVRQYWDLGRAVTCGTPILWNHDPDRFLGQWEQHAVRDLDAGRALVARPRFDLEDSEAANRARQARAGLLRANSSGWRPGERIRRSALDAADPLYTAALEDDCGQPSEGFVMGSERGPNLLIESSFTPIPSDRHAVQAGRLYAAAEREIAASGAKGIDALLALASGDPRTRAFIRRIVREEWAALDATRNVSTPTVADYLGRPRS